MNIISPGTVEVDFVPGSSIQDAIHEAIDHARDTGQSVQFSFNGVKFFLSPQSDSDISIEQYFERLKPITGEPPNDNP